MFDDGRVSARGRPARRRRSRARASTAYDAARAAVRRPASTARRTSTSTAKTGHGQAVPLLRLRRRGVARSRSTASPAVPRCCASTSCTTSATRSRRSSIAARSKAASCRASAGSRSKSCSGTTEGALLTHAARPPTSCRRVGECPTIFDVDVARARRAARRRPRQQGGRRAAADAGDHRPRSAARRGRGVRLPAGSSSSRSPGDAGSRVLGHRARRECDDSGVVSVGDSGVVSTAACRRRRAPSAASAAGRRRPPAAGRESPAANN